MPADVLQERRYSRGRETERRLGIGEEMWAGVVVVDGEWRGGPGGGGGWGGSERPAGRKGRVLKREEGTVEDNAMTRSPPIMAKNEIKAGARHQEEREGKTAGLPPLQDRSAA